MGGEEEEPSGSQDNSTRAKERGFQRGGELNAARRLVRWGDSEVTEWQDQEFLMPQRARPHCSDPRKREGQEVGEKPCPSIRLRETCPLQVSNPSPGER